MRFKKRDLVEVIGYEEGFFGSYYKATIVTDLTRNEYIVSYSDLSKDELSGPVEDVITANYLLSQQPEISIEKFYSGLIVDVFVNDGWWVGKIIRKAVDMYIVNFESTKQESTKQELPYVEDELRLHQEWIKGSWIAANETVNSQKSIIFHTVL